MSTSKDAFARVMRLFPAFKDSTSAEADELYRSFLVCESEQLAEPMDFFKYRFYDFDRSRRLEYLTRRQYERLCRRFNSLSEMRILEDKAEFALEYRPYLGREVIVPTPPERKRYSSLCHRCSHVVLKRLDGGYGRGIHFVETSDPDALWDRCIREGLLVEEPISQHALLARVHPSSVNCIRAVTVRDGSGTVNLIATAFRCGMGSSRTDSGGGLAAAVDAGTGVVDSAAVDHFGVRYETHPDSGVAFRGMTIPNWGSLLSVVESIVKSREGLRMANWDLSLRSDGAWILIEGNAAGGLGPCQEAGGRGLAKTIESILEDR
jgi:hypothetical protein